MPLCHRDRSKRQVIVDGRLRRKQFPTKRKAADWGHDMRKLLAERVRRRTLLDIVNFCEMYAEKARLRVVKKTLIGMGFLQFCNLYTDEVKIRFVPKTHKEKKARSEALAAS